MRIIAGKFRHRKIKMTNLETTRETQDSVREALFNSIGPYFAGGRALDLFCGSGSLGLEALSRGLDEVYFNDLERKALDIAKENVKSLAITEGVYFTNLRYEKALERYEEEGVTFDYIFLDPPYSMNNPQDILANIKSICHENSLIIFEMAANTDANVDGYSILKEKKYGIKKIVQYKKSTLL